MSTSNYYHRSRIHLEITLKTALHIGSGVLESMGKRASDLQGEDSQASDYDRVCLDHQNKPYLPGSSLRGQLRSLVNNLARQNIDSRIQEDWLRYFFDNDALEKSLGTLRVQDAFLHVLPTVSEYSNSRNSLTGEPLSTRITQGIAIDPVRQVVDAHKLFNYEVIPESTRFKWMIEVDKLEHETLEMLCDVLAVWQHQPMSLGRNKSKGDGQALCSITAVEVATPETISEWLKSTELSSYFKNIDIPYAQNITPENNGTLHYQLISQGIMLINDPDRVKSKTEKQEASPQHVYARLENGTAYIPGKSIKGLLRGHARKVIMTLLLDAGLTHEASSPHAEKLIEEIFGSKSKASAINVSHAKNCAENGEPFRQSFIAVDRFTGGVKDGALFMTEGFVDGVFEGTINVSSHLLPDTRRYPEEAKDWWRGLLLLVIRDMMEGDGSLGWGKAKGYGKFQLTALTHEDIKIMEWPDFETQSTLPVSTLTAWVQALEACIRIIASSTAKADKGVMA